MKNHTTDTNNVKNLISPDNLQSALNEIETAYQEYMREFEELQKEKNIQNNTPAA